MHIRPLLLASFLFLLVSSVAHAQGPGKARAQCKSGRLRAPAVTAPVVAAATHNLAIFYVLPLDIAYEDAVYQRLVEGAHDVRAWYQCATGGLTWDFAFPEIVRVYHGKQTREYYRDNGDWWGSLLGEMSDNGQPIWSSGTVTALLARGAGWWAGAAQGCEGECGVGIVGVEAFPEFNRPEFSGGECPAAPGTGAWPCTPLGALAHELGHTLGLPHPLDVPSTSADALHSIMQTHWNYPNFATGTDAPWGFLTLERQKLHANPFLLGGIDLLQPHNCDVVNLPVTGRAPTAAFALFTDGLAIATTNSSRNATLNYWTFGDAHVSGAVDATHTYDQPGTYTIALRTSAQNAMMALRRADVELGACGVLSARLNARPGLGTQPARLQLRASVETLPGAAIDPAANAVTVRIGTLVLEIPAGSFVGREGRWQFSGTVAGLTVNSVVRSVGGSRYTFTLDARGAAAAVSPTDPVTLTIGAGSWCSTT